jgi:SAM-dependent methyltransferase
LVVTTATKTGFYADPVIYDILHHAGTADEARVIEGIAREAGGRRGGSAALTFLEPACGTARHLRALARMGHQGIGFDLSQTMIDDAAARAARAGLTGRMTLFTADMTDFADRVPQRADAAFNLINTVRHLPTDRAMLAHLDHMARSLQPTGVYIVGMSVTDYDLEQPSEDVWAGARGSCRVTQTVNYVPPEDRAARNETVISHMHIVRPSGEEHRDTRYTLRTYTLDELTGLIDRSAMRIDAVSDDLGDEMDPPTIGYALFHLRPR